MAKAKQKYNVYFRRTVFDYTDDPEMFVEYETFVGTTYAVSEAQAVNQVRYRNGDKFNYMGNQYHECFYKAIPVLQDNEKLHERYTDARVML